jgi:predicted Fe-S protein YdhL (DUF1289 family)
MIIHEAFEADLPRLWADERAVRQICLNLLSNAIKFTPQGGEIWVKAGWTASGGQYLSVKDTGPGIPEEEIPIVLASFGQGSNSIKSAEQGAGLGLPIAKSLVDLHGGTFSLKSKLRIGTEVIVTFPPERVMAALAPLAEPAPSIQPQAEATSSQPAPLSALPVKFIPHENHKCCLPPDDAYVRRRASVVESMTFAVSPPLIESPCNKICTIAPVSGLCVGCGRSLAEIANWIGYSDGERARIMAELLGRLESMRRSAPA